MLKIRYEILDSDLGGEACELALHVVSKDASSDKYDLDLTTLPYCEYVHQLFDEAYGKLSLIDSDLTSFLLKSFIQLGFMLDGFLDFDVCQMDTYEAVNLYQPLDDVYLHVYTYDMAVCYRFSGSVHCPSEIFTEGALFKHGAAYAFEDYLSKEYASFYRQCLTLQLSRTSDCFLQDYLSHFFSQSSLILNEKLLEE